MNKPIRTDKVKERLLTAIDNLSGLECEERLVIIGCLVAWFDLRGVTITTEAQDE